MTSFTLAGRKALVTGASRGIGAAIAEGLAAAGAAVMIGDILEDMGRDTARLILGGTAATTGFVTMDVTKEEDWRRAVEATLTTLGGFDILVNNAGIEVTALIVDSAIADLRR